MLEPRLTLKDLTYFRVLAEELHYTKAANRLRVAQPYLSSHIKDLERRLGVCLVERTTRSVGLTAAGQNLFERSRYLLSQLESTVDSVRQAGSDARDVIKVGFTASAGRDIVPWILTEFRRRCPSVRVELSALQTAEQIPLLLDGQLDFGFVRPPLGTSKLVAPVLQKEGAVIALPVGHPLSFQKYVSLSELRRLDFVQSCDLLGFSYQEQVISLCQRAGFTPQRVADAPDLYASVVLIASGFGVAIMPEWITSYVHPGVVYKSIPEISKCIEVAAAWANDKSDNMNDAVGLAFKDVVQSYIKNHSLNFLPDIERAGNSG